MKHVFIFIESDLRGKFFYRFKNALQKKMYKIIIITSCPTVWYRAKKQGDIIYLLSDEKYDQDYSIPLNGEVLEIQSGELSSVAAKSIANSWGGKIRRIAKKYPADLCMIYNGTTLLPYVAKCWAKKENVKSIFFELSNIPGKMFVDKWGTNAKSYLYAHPEILDEYEISDIEYRCWKENYFKNKSIVKQAAFSSQIQSVLLFAVNHLYFSSLLPGLKDKIIYIKSWFYKFLKRYRFKSNHTKKLSFNVLDYKPYYLFPMQVTSDSQVLLNSNVSLLDAVGIAMKESSENNVNLIIKPHPAELDSTIYSRIHKQYPQAIILNGDIKEMIRYAEKIITINSTAGLESILLGKKVEFLGKSFYRYFSQRQDLLYKYILGYLINIDYFASDEITEEILEECLQR